MIWTLMTEDHERRVMSFERENKNVNNNNQEDARRSDTEEWQKMCDIMRFVVLLLLWLLLGGPAQS